VHDLFVEVLGELGLDWPDDRTALWQMVRLTARQIVDGTLDPYAGASWIWWNAAHDLEPEGDLRVFIGLASSYEDLPAYRDQLRREMIHAAEDLLSRPELRPWLQLRADVDHPMRRSTTRGTGLPVDPRDLHLPARVVAQVDAWQRAWRDVESREGFDSPEHATRFVEDGRELAGAAEEALGDAWVVEYHPEPTEPPGVRLRPRGWRRLLIGR
jgi:hypothetical protein